MNQSLDSEQSSSEAVGKVRKTLNGYFAAAVLLAGSAAIFGISKPQMQDNRDSKTPSLSIHSTATPCSAKPEPLPSPLHGLLDLLTQVSETTGDTQLEVLSRKGLYRFPSVSQKQLMFGVSIDGLFFVDRLFDQIAPAIAAPLRLFQQQRILQPGREELHVDPRFLEQERTALLPRAMRGLRGLAGRLGAGPVRVKRSPPVPRSVGLPICAFLNKELLLDRPGAKTLYEDVTYDLFHQPPPGTTDSWLFVQHGPGQL